jgi:hypothetical protein
MRKPWRRATSKPVVVCEDMSRLLIEKKTGRSAGNYGLAPKKWAAQLDEIRALPERGPFA